MREVYADHAATTRPAPEVVEAMLPFLGERFGNASSVHARGEAARAAIDRARAQVAALCGATAEQVVFTATGSEANALALHGTFALAPTGRRRVVVSAIEHPSVLESARALERHGAALTILPVDGEGVLDLDACRAAMGPDVAVVSVMLANNETGTVQPVAEVAALAHAAGARVHTDAVQMAGKQPLDLAALGVDLLTIAGHKFQGPSGAAALLVRPRVRLEPIVHGGHQERSRRAGTENLPALVGFGVAAELARRRAPEEGARLAELTEALWRGIEAGIPSVHRHGDPVRRVGSILNLRFDGLDGEAVLHELDQAGITVSTGSACSAASPGPSHVLMAMGLRAEDAHASVRFSFGATSTGSEIERVLECLPEIVARLRALAPSAMHRSA